ALAKEADSEIKESLALTKAAIHLASKDRATRHAAIRALAESSNPTTKTLLLGVLEQKGGTYVEPDAELRAEADKSLRSVETKLATGEMIGRVFSGIS